MSSETDPLLALASGEMDGSFEPKQALSLDFTYVQ